jgi:hypothetical protein
VRKGSYKLDSGTTAHWDEVVLAMEGPEVRARRRTADPSGQSPVFVRLEDERFLSYRFERAGTSLRATAAVSAVQGAALGEPAGPADAAPSLSAALIAMEILHPVELPDPGARVEPTSVNVRLRVTGGRERVAAVPRAVLQRLVRGREIDLTPDRPLPGFTPVADVLGTSAAMLVFQSPDETRAPWSAPVTPRPGEEDGARIARALTRWWSADASSPARAIVGTDRATSAPRWERAPRLDGVVSVLPPECPVAAQATLVRAGLDGLSSNAAGKLVVLVSAESPGVLGKRLRALALDPALAGKTLAVASLGGPLRSDLPASLLQDGRLAALGVYDAGPVGQSRSVEEVARFVRSAVSATAKGRRVEELAGPFTWYY